ncbi:MAG: DUF3854 domain-containing protein [Candidatus Tectomicrobia bacterium]|uniref:DUF3854 domain-containing protein n=1 Tax=Tectimicrobiota bacterium TaxID=2528274 RepID=A0A937W4V1_UNCTE|nr:DUF3854 domain-containing protein [Candidatus Tectomicrobia bacterium]
MTTWADVGIALPFGATGELRTLCPQCSPSRRKSSVACLAVNADAGTWLCHHCGWRGRLRGRSLTPPRYAPPASTAAMAPPRAGAATIDHVYRTLLTMLPLMAAHHQALQQRGLSDAHITWYGYRTLPRAGRAALAQRLVAQYGGDVCAQVPGLHQVERDGQRWWSLAGAAGLLLPVRTLDGRMVALKVRADVPGDGPKYTSVSSTKHGGPSPGAQVHVPLHAQAPGETVRLTEGELKADVATALSGLLTISVPGVGMWRAALPVLQTLRPQRVRLAFDSDWRTNPQVAQAFSQAAMVLQREGYVVEVEDWEPALGKGIDDVLAAGHVPPVQSAALALGAGLWSLARTWTGTLATRPAQEVPAWH